MDVMAWIEEGKQVAAIWLLFGAVILVGTGLSLVRPPGGFVALEFPAWESLEGIAAPGEWNEAEREKAQFGLGLDFLYLVLYPLFLSLLCGYASVQWALPTRLAETSRVAGKWVLLACPLDAAENLAIYCWLGGEGGRGIQWTITLIAAAKWLIVLATLVIAASALVVLAWTRFQRGSG